jgi:hypothetical protein
MAMSINLSSNSTGQYSFSSSTLVIPPGNDEGSFTYQDDKAAAVSISAVAGSLPVTTLPLTIQPGAFSQLQVLFAGQVSDPGQPTADPSGHLGNPGTTTTGSTVNIVINAVDSFFNPVTTVANDPVNLTSNSPVFLAQGPATLTAGTTSHNIVFTTAGGWTVTGTDSGAKTGTSDTITVQQGTNTTLLNVVHASPSLSTVVKNETGISVFVFNLQVQQGSQSVDLESLAVHAEDQKGNDVPMNAAFQNLALVDSAPQSLSLDVSSDNSAFATLGAGGPIVVNSGGAPLPVTLIAETAASPSAQTVELVVDQNNRNNNGVTYLTGINSVTNQPIGFSTAGDPTGFPMVSGLMVFSDGNVADTFGNYPNPFHAGSEDTTIDFYLTNAASSASVEIYDVMGNQVISLPDPGPLVGLQKILWDGKNGMGVLVRNGIYFAQLTVDGNKLSNLVKIGVAK